MEDFCPELGNMLLNIQLEVVANERFPRYGLGDIATQIIC